MIMTTSAPSATEILDILVVEDLPASQKLLDRILQGAGHRVRVAANGLEAIRRFRELVPDLIVMDLQMPILDGLQTSTILRVLQSSAPQVPIIATTAHGPAFDRARFSSIGVDAFLPKPIEARQLVRLVRELTAKSHHMPHDHAATDGLPLDNLGESAQIDIPGTLVRLNGDQQLLTALVGFFFEDFPALLDEIRAGFQRGDWPRVQRSAHSLKGLAANFGAAPAVAALQKLETGSGDFDAPAQKQHLKETEAAVARLAAALVDYHAASAEPDG
jgi:two-component system, sensor histidine kinase and response regulator